MATIFISYAHENRAMAEKLATWFENHMLQVWWDPAIKPQDYIRLEIEQKLRTSICVIVLWCQEATRSRYVIDEASRALEDGKLIQVTVDGAKPPLGFGGSVERIIEVGDANANMHDPAFNELTRAVRRYLPDVGKLDELQEEITQLQGAVTALKAQVQQIQEDVDTLNNAAEDPDATASTATNEAGARDEKPEAAPPDAIGTDVLVANRDSPVTPVPRSGRMALATPDLEVPPRTAATATAADTPEPEPARQMMDPDQIIEDAGKWVEQRLGRTVPGQVPLIFGHYFMVVQSTGTITNGSIVTGADWHEGTPWTEWEVKGGWVAANTLLHCQKLNGVTYLGPVWRDSFAELGEAVRKRTGARKGPVAVPYKE